MVFLDRDGVINEYPGDFKYVTSLEQFRLLPGVGLALRKLNDLGFKLHVISNQAGVGKGEYPQKTLDLITQNMLEGLKKYGVDISGVYYCTHRPEDNCSCRKPKAGMIHTVIEQVKSKGGKLDIEESFFIGDTMRDIETGKSAGLKTILVFSGKEKPENKSNWQQVPDFTARDLSEAVDIIINRGII